MRGLAAIFWIALAACGGDEAPGEDAGPARDAAPEDDAAADAGGEEALDPATFGPYAIGVATVALTDESRARTLPVEIWYPADLDVEPGAPNVYDLGTIGEISTAARRDAAPAAGRFPLVLFSHGFAGIRFQSYFLTEHLASHGYVVAAPDHVGNTIADLASLSDDAAIAQSAVDRPLDLEFLLDRMLAGDTGVAVTVEPTRVATSGHSFGGWTALETARQDDRIAAVLSLAPGFRVDARPEDTADIERPVALFGGSADETTPFLTGQQPAYEAAAPPKLLVEVLGAGHLDYSDLCEIVELATVFGDGCNPELIDPALVRAIAATISTAWLGRFLLGDERWDPFLADDALHALGPLEVWSEP